MAQKKWAVEIEGWRHVVQLDHAFWSGKRTIIVDGRALDLPRHEQRKFFDTGSDHRFQIAGHPCIVRIRSTGWGFSYDLLVDGRSVETGIQVEPESGGKEEQQSQQASAQFQLMQREVRSWGRVLIFIGIIHLVGSEALEAGWGVALILVGLASFLFREAAMFVIYGTTIAWAALFNLAGRGLWMAFSLVQCYLAVQTFRQFRRFRHAELSFAPSAEGSQGSSLQLRGRRAFPWIAFAFGVVSLVGTIVTVIGNIATAGKGAPVSDRLLQGQIFSAELGVLAVAFGSAALASGYRFRALSVLAIIAGGIPVLILAAIIVLDLITG